ncbi:Glu-tRNA(Gln) amidotransferase subunit GatE [Candidatus Woesearchaeota archaeon]|nr:Glu-tRNA(Gln) amidotransferase subunit GatE [Candidatus Woesearchaeota archaeon]
MEEINFESLGLKCGLEIHQQLDTNKLFCNCPSILRDDKPDITFKRHLHASAGELGDVDIAAKHEKLKSQTFVYEAYSDTTCLVELDEEPPAPMDRGALDVALQVSLMLGSNIVDEINVMRKTIINGSVVSGFQRTALISMGGKIETSQGDVRIKTLLLEEDAAKEISRDYSTVVYRLDRQGIPLIELSTEPDIKSPEQAREAAETLGLLLRSTGRAKRGLGTIRQDVNISIKGGSRIEVKGFQDLRSLPTLVKYEVLRQQNLLKIKDELPKSVKFPKTFTDVTHIFKESESTVIKNALSDNGIVLAVKLPGFAGFVGREVQPGRRLGTEFSDRAKVKAGVGGIFHSDELPKYGITEKLVKAVKKELKCIKDDAFVLVADKPFKAEPALMAVIDRAEETLQGIPEEVRKPNSDSTTSYMRPIPGAARMYPETDVRPIRPDTNDILIPELISDKSLRFERKLGLGKDLADLIAKSPKVTLFEDFVKRFKNIKPAFIAELLVPKLKELKRKHNLEHAKVSRTEYESLFLNLDNGLISKESVEDIMLKHIKGEHVDYSDYKLLTDDEIKSMLKDIVKKNKGAKFNVVMGKAMSELRGKAEGQKIAEFLKKMVK